SCAAVSRHLHPIPARRSTDHAIGSHLGPLVIMAFVSVAWSVFVAVVIGRLVFRRDWFEHSLAEFGESQGNVATGFVMLDMADPGRLTDVARAYSYRQLLTRPIVGGGFLTALAVPLIDMWGLLAFTIVATAITVGLILWGTRRAAARERVSTLVRPDA